MNPPDPGSAAPCAAVGQPTLVDDALSLPGRRVSPAVVFKIRPLFINRSGKPALKDFLLQTAFHFIGKSEINLLIGEGEETLSAAMHSRVHAITAG